MKTQLNKQHLYIVIVLVYDTFLRYHFQIKFLIKILIFVIFCYYILWDNILIV